MTWKARLRGPFEFAVGWTAVALPAFAALGRVATEPVWRDDLASVRGVGLVAVGGSATLTTMAMQAISLVPLGPLSFRIALVSTLALVICGALIQRFARQALETHVKGSFLNAPLAAIASLTVTLGPAMQGEATVGGGATIGLAAALAVFLAAFTPESDQREPHKAPRNSRGRSPLIGTGPSDRHVLTAAALGVLFSESLLTFGVVLLALIPAFVLRRDVPTGKNALQALAVLTLIGVVMCLPTLLRPYAPRVMLDAGLSLTDGGLTAIDNLAERTTALAAWMSGVGTLSLAVAGLGAVVGMLRHRTRPIVAPLLVMVAADIAFPATTGAVLTTDPLVSVRALAIAAIAVAGVLGVQAAATTLIDTGLPMARTVAVLVLIFNLTLVAVTSEKAAFSMNRSEHRGATAYADEALMKLEPKAMVLARSHALVWRMIGAQVMTGARPDVTIIPVPLISRGSVSSRVLSVEPATSLMLRDFALDGAPSPHAVSHLADRRPLYVELDPSWNRKLAAHLLPDGLWLRLLSQPLGWSDRKIAIKETSGPVKKVIAASGGKQPFDRATSSVVTASLRQQTLAVALARDKRAARQMLETLAALSPEDRFVRAMTQRIEHAKGSRIDVVGLAH